MCAKSITPCPLHTRGGRAHRGERTAWVSVYLCVLGVGSEASQPHPIAGQPSAVVGLAPGIPLRAHGQAVGEGIALSYSRARNDTPIIPTPTSLPHTTPPPYAYVLPCRLKTMPPLLGC